ncbi:MAG: GNAT family N-acetyltransferase [Actinomycetota bacterium]
MGPAEGERLRLEADLAASETKLMRLATATQHKSRWRIAVTALKRAEALVGLGRYGEGLAACTEFTARYGGAPDTPTQVLVASALRLQAQALHGLGQARQELAACMETVHRFESAGDPVLREVTAQALLAASGIHDELGEPDPAAAALQELLRRGSEPGATPALTAAVTAARDRLAAPPVTVRDARPHELEAIGALTVRSFDEYLPLVSAEFAEHFHADATDLRSRLEVAQVLVAEAGAGLTGTVTLLPDGQHYQMPGWPKEWAVVRLLAVDPAARARGAGRRLVAVCIARARDLGAPAIGLHTAEFMHPAQRVYTGFGFERVPALDVDMPGGGSSARAFRLWLRPPS